MPPILKVGVAGLGFGSAVHIPALRSIPGVEIVAVCGRRLDKTQGVAAQFGIPAACTSIEQLLDRDLHAVTIALPPLANATAVTAALDRNLAIFVEKPLAPTPRESWHLAHRAQGNPAAVDFEFVRTATFRHVKDWVSSGRLGTLKQARIQWCRRSYAHESRHWSWKTDADEHGGALTLFASHLFFLIEWLFGPVRLHSAQLSNAATQALAPSGRRGADNAATLELQTDAGSSISIAIDNASQLAPLHRWEVIGDRGQITIENASNFAIRGLSARCTDHQGASIEVGEPESDGDDRLPPVCALMTAFVDAVRGQHTAWPDFAAAARAQELIAAARALA